jgi:two-component system phosphate regulon sensor histidine kinase PhoR
VNYWLIGFLVSAAVATLLGWRYLHLRRELRAYASALRQQGAAASAVGGQLDPLSHAIAAMTAESARQLSELREEHRRLSALINQMTDGVLMVDADGRVEFANLAAERLFGADLVGRTVAETLRHHQLIGAWQRSQTSRDVENESIDVPASHQFLQLLAIPDPLSSGRSLLLVQDLTRLRRLETVRRDFIGNLSHELRTPLASLKALSETLQYGALEDPPAATRFLAQINVEVDALIQIVNELLELSQIESGKLSLELKAGSMRDLLTSAANRMRMQAERAGLRLKVECADDLPAVRMDAGRLEQVLVNLIHNAVKFSPAGGEIVLRADEQAGMVQAAVADTGVGIAQEDLPRIFERFYKSDRARSGGGTGLGLSIARHIVEAHQGRIWAESTEGSGSTFFFEIPSLETS